jgi:hypothetical protein
MESLKEAFNSFSRMFGAYTYFSFLGVLFHFLTIFAAFGILILIFFLFSLFNYKFFSLLGAIASVIVGAAALWFVAGIHGARARFYYNLLNGRSYNILTGFTEFLNYALRNASKFFLVSLIRLISIAIPLALLFVVYTFLQQYRVPYIEIVFAIAALATLFVIHFLFFPVFISVAVYENGLRAAFRNAARLFLNANIRALAIYSIYAIAWFVSLIPFVQLITYPLAYTSLIVHFKKYAR